MMTKTSWIWSALFTLSMSAGCDEPVDADDSEEANDAFGEGDVTDRCPLCSGIKLNTGKSGLFEWSNVPVKFNSPQGGTTLQGIKTTQLSDIDEMWVDKGYLFGKKNGSTYNEKIFLNSEWRLRFDTENGPLDATIKLVSIGTAGGSRVYTFDNIYLSSGKLGPVCDKEAEFNSSTAYAMALIADVDVDSKGKFTDKPGTVFFGCISGGVGKAVTWGYPRHNHTLKDFEGAVRMVRADYCGTGHSFTKAGQSVDVEDIFGVSKFDNPLSPTEAIWGPGGARCVFKPRYGNFPDYATIKQECTNLGATPPKECKPNETMATYSGIFWTKKP